MSVFYFSMAFDKRLIDKLKWHDISVKTIDYVNNFLSHRTPSVVLDGISSNIILASHAQYFSDLSPSLILFYNDGITYCNHISLCSLHDNLHSYEE